MYYCWDGCAQHWAYQKSGPRTVVSVQTIMSHLLFAVMSRLAMQQINKQTTNKPPTNNKQQTTDKKHKKQTPNNKQTNKKTNNYVLPPVCIYVSVSNATNKQTHKRTRKHTNNYC